MKQDRKAICDIISEMLDNPDGSSIYPTSTAFTKLEHYIERVRHISIGWMQADACTALDRGLDPRTMDVPGVIARARIDLEEEEWDSSKHGTGPLTGDY